MLDLKNDQFNTLLASLLASYSVEELLLFLASSGKLDLSSAEQEMKQAQKKKILKAHPYTITVNPKNGRAQTYVRDETKPSKRRKIDKKSRKELEEALCEWYLANDDEFRKEQLTMAEFYADWFKHKSLQVADVTMLRIESDWKKYYEGSDIIDRPMKTLNKAILEDWAFGLIRKYDLTRTKYTNIQLIMRGMLNYACDLEIISNNPFERVKPPSRIFRQVRKKSGPDEVYSSEEERALVETALDNFYNSKRLVHRLSPLAVIFCLLTGLRAGEVVAITFADVDADKHILHINKMYRRDTRTVVPHTKSHQDRKVILTDEALEIIEMCRKYHDEHNIKGNYIFSVNDGPLYYGQINELLKRYCKTAGIKFRSSHKLRKTCISKEIDAHVNIDTIREQAGHRDIETTYNSYVFDRAPDEQKIHQIEEAVRVDFSRISQHFSNQQ